MGLPLTLSQAGGERARQTRNPTTKWKYIRPCRAKRMPIRKHLKSFQIQCLREKEQLLLTWLTQSVNHVCPTVFIPRFYREGDSLISTVWLQETWTSCSTSERWHDCRGQGFLGKLLQEVAHLNTQDRSYSLKNCVFKELQRDWPVQWAGQAGIGVSACQKSTSTFQSYWNRHNPQVSIDSSTDEIFCPSQETALQFSWHWLCKEQKVRISHLTTKQQPASSDCFSNTSESAMGHPPYSESTTQS